MFVTNIENQALVIVSPVWDESRLTEPAVAGLSDNPGAATGETMTKAENHILLRSL